MFDERPAGANLGGRSVTMFGDAAIIIQSLAVVCAGQIENNKTPASRRYPLFRDASRYSPRGGNFPTVFPRRFSYRIPALRSPGDSAESD